MNRYKQRQNQKPNKDNNQEPRALGPRMPVPELGRRVSHRPRGAFSASRQQGILYRIKSSTDECTL